MVGTYGGGGGTEKMRGGKRDGYQGLSRSGKHFPRKDQSTNEHDLDFFHHAWRASSTYPNILAHHCHFSLVNCYVTVGTFTRRGLSSTAKTLRSLSGVRGSEY